MQTPVTVYVVHHPQCSEAETLARQLYQWFRLGYLAGDSSAAGLPVYFRRHVTGAPDARFDPPLPYHQAEVNVVILLVDLKMVHDPRWRHAAVHLANEIDGLRNGAAGTSRTLLLPVALHDSFYRTGPLYDRFNPIRLLGMTPDQMIATVRRGTTEAMARLMRATNAHQPPPLNVFLSHAKRDGAQIAECLRDGVRKFSQLVAWYDANDLPFGAAWESPMKKAANQDTAAMIATITDAYPTRPWCRQEAKLARTPRRLRESPPGRVWTTQPVVAVQHPGANWVRGVSMLDGVPRIGWNPDRKDVDTETVIDRLVLEVLLGYVHRKLATNLESQLEQRLTPQQLDEYCFITWVPDTWSLVSLRQQLDNPPGKEGDKQVDKQNIKSASIRRIVYPGYGLSAAELDELKPAVAIFSDATRLISYDDPEVWS